MYVVWRGKGVSKFLNGKRARETRKTELQREGGLQQNITEVILAQQTEKRGFQKV
jgi:hypothetical protein